MDADRFVVSAQDAFPLSLLHCLEEFTHDFCVSFRFSLPIELSCKISRCVEYGHPWFHLPDKHARVHRRVTISDCDCRRLVGSADEGGAATIVEERTCEGESARTEQTLHAGRDAAKALAPASVYLKSMPARVDRQLRTSARQAWPQRSRAKGRIQFAFFIRQQAVPLHVRGATVRSFCCEKSNL
jgi:hypothetical protein